MIWCLITGHLEITTTPGPVKFIQPDHLTRESNETIINAVKCYLLNS